MPGPRYPSPDNQATQPYRAVPPSGDHRPSGGHRRAAPAGPGTTASRLPVISLLAGAGTLIVVLLLGLLAKTGPLARADLHVDEHIAAHDRVGVLTGLAKAATIVATPEIAGPALMIIIPAILLVMRRRLDAAKVFCMFAGALAVAEIVKNLINEHRPPVALQAMAADASGSYPSGHATTAAILAVSLTVIAATKAGRTAAITLGGLFAVTVAASRVYLGDHYPADVVGAMLCALAAGLIVTGLAALPAARPWLQRFKLTTGPAPRHR
jgi:membrane-associated phospholipid phosphatase